MKYRYRSDAELKDSGVEWIGKIPKDWEVIRGKFLFDNKKIKNSGAMNNVLSLTLNGVIDRDINNFEGLQPESFDGYQEFKKDNLVFKLIDLENISTSRVGIVHRNGLMSPAYIRLEEKKDINMKYYYYNYFDYYNKNIFNFLGSAGVRSALNSTDLLEMQVLNLDKKEQEKIANFLDEKTLQFDLIIYNKEVLIQRLEEWKKSIISEVVTGKIKVVNTNNGYELVKRSSEEMKDSGVEWLGYIPKNWDIKRIKYLFNIKKDIAGKTGYDILSVTQSGIKIKDTTKNEGQLSMDYSKYQIVDIGNFVMNHMDLLTGFVDCSKFKGVTSPDYRVFYLKDDNNCKQYYNYIFQLCYYNRVFYGLAQGVSGMGRWRLQTDTFKNFIIPMPSYKEQDVIARFLQDKLNDIEILKKRLNINIQKLKKARQSLISEAVTGKIEILD